MKTLKWLYKDEVFNEMRIIDSLYTGELLIAVRMLECIGIKCV